MPKSKQTAEAKSKRGGKRAGAGRKPKAETVVAEPLIPPESKVAEALDAAESLTWKQRLFVVAYLGVANGNATEAARIAGYGSPSERGHETVRNRQVQAAIAACLSEAAPPADEILARLAEHAGADLADFVDVTAFGFSLNLERARRAGKTHLIKKLAHTKYGVSIELHDPQAALVHLGRYRKLFVDRLEHEFSDKSNDELLALAAAEGLAGRDRETGPDAGGPDG